MLTIQAQKIPKKQEQKWLYSMSRWKKKTALINERKLEKEMRWNK